VRTRAGALRQQSLSSFKVYVLNSYKCQLLRHMIMYTCHAGMVLDLTELDHADNSFLLDSVCKIGCVAFVLARAGTWQKPPQPKTQPRSANLLPAAGLDS
jgi:hypothetical protein